jgi:hypothetical protein
MMNKIASTLDAYLNFRVFGVSGKDCNAMRMMMVIPTMMSAMIQSMIFIEEIVLVIS